jgi:hypothetical protein
MASGLDDSAQTLYYSNINYNSSNVPKSSFVSTDLQSRFLFNQSNYQCSINKLKLTSLEGIRIGVLPYQEWELGLCIADSAGTPHYSNVYVSLPNEQGTIDYFQNITYVDSNTFQVVNCNYNNLGNYSELNTFTPINGGGDNVYPIFASYDNINNVYWVVDYTSIYVYDDSNTLLDVKVLTNNISAFFDNTKGYLLVCEGFQGADTNNKVQVWGLVDGTITLINAIRNNFADNALSNIQCCASDGTTIIIGYNNNVITTYNATTYAPIDDTILPSVNFIQSIVVSTTDNNFFILDNKLTPSIFVNTNSDLPVNLVNFNGGGQTIIEAPQTINSISVNTAGYVFTSYGSIDIQSSPIPPNSGLYIGTVQSITPSTIYNTTYATGFQPFFITNYYNKTTNEQLNIGVSTIDSSIEGQVIIVAQSVDNVWYNVYTFNEATGDAPPQITVDTQGYVYIVSNYAPGGVYRSSAPPIVLQSAPFLDFTGITFIQCNFNYSGSIENRCDSITFDQQNQNICYVVYNNIIWTGFLKANYNNYDFMFVLRQYNWSLEFVSKYITIPPLNSYTIGTNSFHIKNFELSTFTENNETITNDILLNIAKNLRDNLLVASDITTNKINTYNFTTSEPIGNLIQPPNITVGFVSSYTTSQLIRPTLQQEAVYDMGTYITAFNVCFEAIYALLKAQIPAIPIPTAPFFTLDYTTRKLTLNYDPKYSTTNNGIYVNNALLRYALFPTIAGDGDLSTFNKYVLSSSGSITQSKETMYLLNDVDKLIIVSNMSLNSDYSGQIQSSVFTDLDFDTQVQFFNMDGNFIYSAILLRKYDMTSNTTLRNITYEIFVQYKDESQTPYLIQPGENISIKFEFDRLY